MKDIIDFYYIYLFMPLWVVIRGLNGRFRSWNSSFSQVLVVCLHKYWIFLVCLHKIYIHWFASTSTWDLMKMWRISSTLDRPLVVTYFYWRNYYRMIICLNLLLFLTSHFFSFFSWQLCFLSVYMLLLLVCTLSFQTSYHLLQKFNIHQKTGKRKKEKICL